MVKDVWEGERRKKTEIKKFIHPKIMPFHALKVSVTHIIRQLSKKCKNDVIRSYLKVSKMKFRCQFLGGFDLNFNHTFKGLWRKIKCINLMFTPD